MPATLTINALGTKWKIKDNDDGSVSGTAVWQVRASEPTTPLYVRNHATVTAVITRGKDYPGSSAGELPCRSVDIDVKDEARTLFIVTGDYSNSQSYSTTENPLDAPAKFSYATESFEETYFEDKTTPTPKLARNTAGTPFTELPKRDNAIDVITITKNVADTTTNSDVKALRNKVNSDSVTLDGVTYAAGKLRVTSTSLSEVKTQNGYSYKERQLTVKVNDAGWDQKFESLGLEQLISGVNWPIIDPNTKATIKDPWPLKSDGTKETSRATKGAEITLKPYASTALNGALA